MPASDPALVRFSAPYHRSAGFASYRSKLSEAERDALFAAAALPSSSHALSLAGRPPGSPPKSPPRAYSIALPGPMAATTTSFGEIKSYKERNVVPKYAPAQRFEAPVTEAMEAGWRALESVPSAAARQFSRALAGKS